MGKKRSAARRATATAAVASAAIPSPAVSIDTHAALIDTPPASVVRESPANTQQPRVSHEADATRAPRAASPAHPHVDTKLVHEPAALDEREDVHVAIATVQTRTANACPEPRDTLPALTTHTSTSSDVSANSPQQSRVSNHTDTLTAPKNSFPALSVPAAAAAADLATAIDTAGPPTVFLACPTHVFCRAEDFSHEPELLAPRTHPATSIEEIDEELLENIIEDAQNTTRIEARREVRVKALEEGRVRGWKDGLEEGRKLARRDARAEARQREQSWKDGYEQGRWEGYREGLEVARAEVSTTPRIDAIVQADDAIPPHPRSIDMVPATSRVDADVQTDNPTPTLSPPACACNMTPRFDPATPCVDAGIQSDAPTRALAPTPRIHVSVQADASTSPRSIPIDMTASPHLHVGIQADAAPSPIVRIHASVQADDPAPPSPPDDTHPPPRRVQASAQTDPPRASAPARARTPHEIEPVLLREIIATASARGEAAGLKQGKHTGFQDGMEAGWKSGTREGREEGYTEGKKDGINEGYERHRLEVSRVPHAVAVVQTDDIPLPTDSTSRTDPLRADPDTLVHITQHTVNNPPVPTTTISNDSSMSHNDLSLSHNDTIASFPTAHTHLPSFSWADEASSLPTTSAAPLISPPPRDFSVLRSSSARPFDSLKRRARRSQAWPIRPSRPSRPFIPSSEPIITRRHPAGLRADRPAMVISPSSTISHSVKLDTLPLDWQGDPRLHELGRVLRGLGWVHSSGS